MTSEATWASLPIEIRLMILKELVEDGCPLAPFATVCRGWQRIIEQKTFARLKLTSSRLANFGKITRRRRKLVKYIWLCIELPEYDCLWCDDSDTDQVIGPDDVIDMDKLGVDPWDERNDTIIQTTFEDFVRILSKWKPHGELLLDMSVHSPSDAKHHFKHLHFGSNAVPQTPIDDNVVGAYEPHSGWVDGLQVSPPSEVYMDRVFRTMYAVDQELPKVTAVTSFLLRRQTRGNWGPLEVEEFLYVFPRLHEFHYEPWRSWFTWDQRSTNSDYRDAFKLIRGHPHPLKRMVLFQDFDENLASALHAKYPSAVEAVSSTSFRVGRTLAKTSLSAEHFSVSFITDALHFFGARKPSWVWNELKSLALTSRLLNPNESHVEINDMLQVAAVAALKMPRLDIVELWNGGKDLACVFRYQASEEYKPVKLTWRANWDISLESRTIRAWGFVGLRRRRRGVSVIKELLDAGVIIKSHGDAIHHLRLENQVVHPVSLWQIRRETNRLITS